MPRKHGDPSSRFGPAELRIRTQLESPPSRASRGTLQESSATQRSRTTRSVAPADLDPDSHRIGAEGESFLRQAVSALPASCGRVDREGAGNVDTIVGVDSDEVSIEGSVMNPGKR